MYLNGNQQRISNNKRKVILDNFKDHRLCNDCNGTGLDNIVNLNGDYSWDGVSFCDKCEGIGYISWKETIMSKLCPKCKGGGHNSRLDKCSVCNGKGVLDWIKYMRVGGKG